MVYDNANRRTTLTLPNNVTVAYTYDNDSRVTGMTYSAGSTQLGDLSYSYDADGRRTSSGGSLAAVTLPSAISGNTSNADNGMTGFNGTTLSYDANGNLTSDGTDTYTWDARNHLTAISGGTTASFVYDALGRRASKSINSSVTQFLYDGLNPVQELNGANPPAVTANLLTGLNIDEYFTRADSSGTMAFLADALGSTVGLVNSGGTINTSYTYQPFGAATIGGTANANPYQFTGRENDGTGLYYYRARYYSPTFQRFVSQDPIDFRADMNLYSYVKNQPTRTPDPTREAPPGSVPPPIEIPINGPGSSPNDPQFPGPPGGAVPPDASTAACSTSDQSSKCPFGSLGACVAAGVSAVSLTEDAALVSCGATAEAAPACLAAVEAAYAGPQIAVVISCHQMCQ